MFDMFSFVLLFWHFVLFFDLNFDLTLLFFAFVCAMEMFALLAVRCFVGFARERWPETKAKQ